MQYEGYLGIELGWDYTIEPEHAARKANDRTRELIDRLN